MIDAAHAAADGVLAELMVLGRATLTERWSSVFGCPAPRHAQAALLRGALAWHHQMAVKAKAGSGGVEPMVRRLRRAVAASTPVQVIAPGTRLLREWQDQTHHVTVLPKGFDYNGKTYRSLTAVARVITGTAWSGPAFFGLR